MKVLWFTNVPLPDYYLRIGKELYHKASWLYALAEALREREDIKLGVVSIVPNCKDLKFESNCVVHYVIGTRYYSDLQAFPSLSLIGSCKDAYRDFSPDLINIFGTEHFYGLLTGLEYIKCPNIIFMQGIIGAYQQYFFGGLSLWDILRTTSMADYYRFNGLMHIYLRRAFYAPIERRIIKSNKNFICVSPWDRAYVKEKNPDAMIFHHEDILRPEFYNRQWDILSIKRHSIFVPTAESPLKGAHIILKAVALLKNEFSDIELRFAFSPLKDYSFSDNLIKRLKRNGFVSFLMYLIKRLGLVNNVVSLGMLSAEEMTDELIRAHVFVAPSLIENRSNAIQEAMLVGTPAIVSYSGGTPSLIEGGKAALSFPAGDEKELAEQVSVLFNDDLLAKKLSNDSRVVALKRNNKEIIVKKLMNIYSEVLR